MVHGKMNLYCITHNSDEFYFFEREDGEMAELTNRVANYQGDAKVALQQAKDDVQENNMVKLNLYCRNHGKQLRGWMTIICQEKAYKCCPRLS